MDMHSQKPGDHPGGDGSSGKSDKPYKVKIDHNHYEFEDRHVTGRQLLTRAGKLPVERFEIELKKGQTYTPVDLDGTVDLGEPGVETFETFPLDETEGA